MDCKNCGQQNTQQSNFCKKCGTSLKISTAKDQKDFFTTKIRQLKKAAANQNKKVLISVAVLVILGASSAYAAPKAMDHIEATNLITKAEKLEQEGKFDQAATVVSNASDLWTLSDTQQEIAEIEKRQEKNQENKESISEALELKMEGDIESLKEARTLLNDIDSDYPQYDEAKKHLSTVQTSIEEKLQEQVEQEEAEAEAARAQAARERRAKVQARQEAEEAAAEREAKEAQARAAREEKEHAEEQAAQERVKAFLDEAVSIYNSILSGEEYTMNALDTYDINYSSSVNSLNQARAIFVEAQERARNMKIYNSVSGFEWVSEELASAAQSYNEGLPYLNTFLAEAGSAYPNIERMENNQERLEYYIDRGDQGLQEISDFLDEHGR